MQGTVLILDGIATNRIILKVQLCASYFQVVQSDRIDGVESLIRLSRPDLIISAMTLPDGNAIDLFERLRKDEAASNIPMIVICAENDRKARMAALAAGIDDVLTHPADDVLLQARIRSLIRARGAVEEFHLREGTPNTLGFSEPPARFLRPSRVALLTSSPGAGVRWRHALALKSPHEFSLHTVGDLPEVMSGDPADVYVIELGDAADQAGLRLMADLRARTATRRSAVIAVVDPPGAARAADALDRGAHDVLSDGYCSEELTLRINAQLRRKAQSDRLRMSVENGLRAAIRDPMTGLHNRLYAMPHLSRMAETAMRTGTQYTVMLADLDHFKRINDRYGHPAGDAVLIETAARLRAGLRPSDLIARIGGEEFMIAMADTDEATAVAMADRLRRQINERPFRVENTEGGIEVTISIGVVVVSPGGSYQPENESSVSRMIRRADRALYSAKDSGRNKVSVFRSAA